MTLLNNLNTLESAGLIRLAQLEPELAYLFRHALVQDAAYATLLSEDRQRLHRAVGEAMEQLYTDRLDGHAPLLAHHFHEAGDNARARRYYTLAGIHALKSYANAEAATLFRRALSLTGTEAECAKVRAGLGESLFRMSRFEEALAVWRAGIDTYRALGDQDGMARLYARSARAAWQGGDTPGSLLLCEEGIAAVAGAPESPDQARLVHEIGRACMFNGLPDKAHAWCSRALDMARRLEVVDVEADTLATMGVLPALPETQALAYLRRGAELAESAGLLEIASRAWHNLGNVTSGIRGDLTNSPTYYERAVDAARRLGSPRHELYSLVNWAATLVPRAEVGKLRDMLPRIDALAARMANPDAVQLEVTGLRATLEWLDNDTEAALARLRAFLAEARRRGDLQMWQTAADQLAGYLMELALLGQPADLTEAENALQDTIAIGDRGIGARTNGRYQLAVLYARQGRLPEARQHLAEGRALEEGEPAVWAAGQQQLAEIAIALAEQRWAAAFAAYESLAQRWAALGAHGPRAQILLQWARALWRHGSPDDLKRAQALLREAQALFDRMDSARYRQIAADALTGVRAALYDQARAHEQAAAELAAAGRLQASFLPERLPELPGWEMAAGLHAARQTSGDFYDALPLPDGRIALLIADVAGKGAEAAMFMAMCGGTLRHAIRAFPAAPHVALHEANERILAETHSDMFITVFLGVLDPADGALAYANAGHNPPLIQAAGGDRRWLTKTGMALGILPEASWRLETATLAPGDVLLLYTDGITEAQNAADELFGEARLETAVAAHAANHAHHIQQALLDAVAAFTAGAPQFDDIACLTLKRLPPTP